MKKIISFLLVFVLALSVMSTAVFADAAAITITSVSATSGKVSFAGTASGVKAAVAVQICKGTDILAMESFPAANGTFSGSIGDLSLTSGTTYVLKAADYDGGQWVTKEFTYTKPSGSSSSVVETFEIPVKNAAGADTAACMAKVADQKATIEEIKIQEDAAAQKLFLDLSKTGAKEIVIPEAVMKTIKEAATEGVEVKTADAALMLDPAALTAVSEAMNGNAAELSVLTGKGAEQILTAEQSGAIENMHTPVVIDVTLKTGDRTVSDFKGGKVQLTVAFDWDGNGILRGDYVSDDGFRESVKTTASEDRKAVTLTLSHFSTYVVYAEDALPFKDVADPMEYYYDPVRWALENEVTSGISAELFGPASTCTRAQMVTFLWNAAGQPFVNYAMPFTDVPEDAYYTEAVRWAASEKITSGTTETTFSPNQTITRAQALTFLANYAHAPVFANMTASGPAPSPFSDVSNTAYYYSAVLWAKAQGITSGTGETTFSPDAPCSRGQIVTFLYKVITQNLVME